MNQVDWLFSNSIRIANREDAVPNEAEQTLLSEMCLLCILFDRNSFFKIRYNSSVNSFIDALYHRYKRPEFYTFINLVPQAINGHLLIWHLLKSRGIKEMINGKFFEPAISIYKEMYPSGFKNFELKYFLYLVGLRNKDYDCSGSDSIELINKYIDKINVLNEKELYILTHTIFYFTDFGRISPSVKILDYKISTEIQLIIKKIKNLDLLIELVICNALLGQHNSVSTFKKIILSKTHTYLSATARSKKKISQEEEFYRNYHPTMMYVILKMVLKNKKDRII